MLTCINCAVAFEDEFQAAVTALFSNGPVECERHGEKGMLHHGPSLCTKCLALPRLQLAEIIEAWLTK